MKGNISFAQLKVRREQFPLCSVDRTRDKRLKLEQRRLMLEIRNNVMRARTGKP